MRIEPINDLQVVEPTPVLQCPVDGETASPTKGAIMTNTEFINAIANEFEMAFLATGLQPVRRDWGDGKTSGCMLTALDVQQHGAQECNSWETPYDLWYRCDHVRDYFAQRFPMLDLNWWADFVEYCFRSYDGFVTFPAQWLKRNGAAPLQCPSAKVLGAAVGGLVYQRLFKAPVIMEEEPIITKDEELLQAR